MYKKLILRSVIQQVPWNLWKKNLMQSQTFPGEPCTVVNLDPKHVVGEIASSICICCSTILLDKFMVFTCQNKGWTTAGISTVCQLLFAFYHKDPIWKTHWKIFETTTSWHFNQRVLSKLSLLSTKHIALQEQQSAYLQILKDVEMPQKFSTRQLYHPNSKCLQIALLKYNSLFRLYLDADHCFRFKTTLTLDT